MNQSLTRSIIDEYQRSISLLAELLPTSKPSLDLLPKWGEPFRWQRRTISDGQDALVVGQRVDLGVLSSLSLNCLATDLLGTIASSGCKRGFRPIGQAEWFSRDSSSIGAPPDSIELNAKTLAETEHLLWVPMEVFGFAFPESPQPTNQLRSWLRPAFQIVAGREFCERRWLTHPNEELLFSCGYTILPGKLRPNPYPYGPGAFDRATKCFEFVRAEQGKVEVRMLALMAPSLAKQMRFKSGRFGALIEKLVVRAGAEHKALKLHVRIHEQALLNAVRPPE
ncbi:MAG: hypothetical protein AAF702_30010 [Chloroflexota bacterium]